LTGGIEAGLVGLIAMDCDEFLELLDIVRAQLDAGRASV
jgi:hypothetical protein